MIYEVQWSLFFWDASPCSLDCITTHKAKMFRATDTRTANLKSSFSYCQSITMKLTPNIRFLKNGSMHKNGWISWKIFTQNYVCMEIQYEIMYSHEVYCIRNVVAHGDAREGKWRGNWRMEWVASTLTRPRNVVYPALLTLMRTPRLPAVDWTVSPADLNGLIRLSERRNVVSARVPSGSAWALTTRAYCSNLSHKCFTGKVICGRLDAITLCFLHVLYCASTVLRHYFIIPNWCTQL